MPIWQSISEMIFHQESVTHRDQQNRISASNNKLVLHTWLFQTVVIINWFMLSQVTYHHIPWLSSKVLHTTGTNSFVKGVQQKFQLNANFTESLIIFTHSDGGLEMVYTRRISSLEISKRQCTSVVMQTIYNKIRFARGYLPTRKVGETIFGSANCGGSCRWPIVQAHDNI